MSTAEAVLATLRAQPGLRASTIAETLDIGIKPVRNALERLQKTCRAYSVPDRGPGSPVRWYPGGYVIPAPAPATHASQATVAAAPPRQILAGARTEWRPIDGRMVQVHIGPTPVPADCARPPPLFAGLGIGRYLPDPRTEAAAHGEAA
jgi:hypothetical protein